MVHIMSVIAYSLFSQFMQAIGHTKLLNIVGSGSTLKSSGGPLLMHRSKCEEKSQKNDNQKTLKRAHFYPSAT